MRSDIPMLNDARNYRACVTGQDQSDIKAMMSSQVEAAVSAEIHQPLRAQLHAMTNAKVTASVKTMLVADTVWRAKLQRILFALTCRFCIVRDCFSTCWKLPVFAFVAFVFGFLCICHCNYLGLGCHSFVAPSGSGHSLRRVFLYAIGPRTVV
jgi:hypothetical protein